VAIREKLVGGLVKVKEVAVIVLAYHELLDRGNEDFDRGEAGADRKEDFDQPT